MGTYDAKRRTILRRLSDATAGENPDPVPRPMPCAEDRSEAARGPLVPIAEGLGSARQIVRMGQSRESIVVRTQLALGVAQDTVTPFIPGHLAARHIQVPYTVAGGLKGETQARLRSGKPQDRKGRGPQALGQDQEREMRFISWVLAAGDQGRG